MKNRLGINLLCLGIAIIWVGIIVGRGVTIGHNFNQSDNWHQYQQKKEIVVGLDDTFVPMGFRKQNGQITGYDVELARLVFKQYGIKVKFQPIDWLMKETELRNGTIDLIWNGYSFTPKRSQVVAFSNPYYRNGQVLVTLKNNNITQLSDLKNQLLGVQSASTGAAELDAHPKILKQYIAHQEPIFYDTFMNAINDLNSGRIKAILVDRVYADYYIDSLKVKNKYQISATSFPVDQFAVGLRKSDVTFKYKIDTALNKLASNGELAKLNQRWFGAK